MSDDNSAKARVRADMFKFRAGFESLSLATVSDTGAPEASAAPMVLGQDGVFYIYISALARHTANLESNPQAGVLLIEPVAAASNPFARQRLSYRCEAAVVPPDTDGFADILQRFKEQFGEIVAVLESLPDFQLFRLTPIRGTYVRGFGQAWHLSGPGLRDLEPMNPARDRSRGAAEQRGGK
jgi:putative heme iron utilization protein